MNIKVEGGLLSFEVDIFRMIEDMSDEEKLEIVEAVTWDKVLKQAIDRLIGESESSSGDDKELTLEVLVKMENHLTSGYKWSHIKELKDLAKNMTAHEHLYWKMFHDSINGDFFRKWLNDNKIESNYTHNLGTFEDFKTMVENKISTMNTENV